MDLGRTNGTFFNGIKVDVATLPTATRFRSARTRC